MLITLVIIGVIAALTIPNLLQKYQEQTTVKKVQKFYSNLANAYSLAIKDNGKADEWGITGYDEESNTKIYNILFKPYFKIAKNCGINNKGNCIANVLYKRLDNLAHNNYASSSLYYKSVLDDGAAVWWRGTVVANEPAIMFIYYDINGEKAPNQWGKDLFQFSITKNKTDKVVPYGIESGASSCKKNSIGDSCGAWVVYKGNMDYLHCDLTWDKNSCKDK